MKSINTAVKSGLQKLFPSRDADEAVKTLSSWKKSLEHFKPHAYPNITVNYNDKVISNNEIRDHSNQFIEGIDKKIEEITGGNIEALDQIDLSVQDQFNELFYKSFNISSQQLVLNRKDEMLKDTDELKRRITDSIEKSILPAHTGIELMQKNKDIEIKIKSISTENMLGNENKILNLIDDNGKTLFELKKQFFDIISKNNQETDIHKVVEKTANMFLEKDFIRPVISELNNFETRQKENMKMDLMHYKLDRIMQKEQPLDKTTLRSHFEEYCQKVCRIGGFKDKITKQISVIRELIREGHEVNLHVDRLGKLIDQWTTISNIFIRRNETSENFEQFNERRQKLGQSVNNFFANTDLLAALNVIETDVLNDTLDVSFEDQILLILSNLHS